MAAPGVVVITDARLPGGAPVDLEIREGRFTIVGIVAPGDGARIDARGATVVPAFVDSHGHLALWLVGRALLDGGVAAAVDLAAPIGSLGAPHTGPLAASHPGPKLAQSGPMITAARGYPTQTWGARGYGLPCAPPDDAAEAVRTLHAAGVDGLAHTPAAPLSDATVAAWPPGRRDPTVLGKPSAVWIDGVKR